MAKLHIDFKSRPIVIALRVPFFTPFFRLVVEMVVMVPSRGGTVGESFSMLFSDLLPVILDNCSCFFRW